MNKPKVSIIVPVYNVEKYLDECIHSILNQTFKDFEVILVDDGSPDNCPQICEEYAKKDSRVIVIHKENGGLSSARNAGLNIARGRYISFIDSDDCVSPVLLETCVNLLKEKTGIDAIKFDYSTSKKELKNFKEEKDLESLSVFNLNDETRLDFICNTLLKYKIRWESWTWLFDGDVIRKNNLRFEDNDVIFAEDIYFSCLYSFFSNSILFIDEPLYFYRVRSGSIMNVTNGAKINELNNLSFLLFERIKDKVSLGEYCLINVGIITNRFRFLPKLLTIKNANVWKTEINRIDNKVYFKNINKKYFENYIFKKRRCFSYDYLLFEYLYSLNFYRLCFKIMVRKILRRK